MTLDFGGQPLLRYGLLYQCRRRWLQFYRFTLFPEPIARPQEGENAAAGSQIAHMVVGMRGRKPGKQHSVYTKTMDFVA